VPIFKEEERYTINDSTRVIVKARGNCSEAKGIAQAQEKIAQTQKELL